MPGDASRRNGLKGGRPKGTRGRGTMDKIAAREFVRQQVTAELRPLLNAQFANAKGLKYLVTRDAKTGKFTRVTQAMLAASEGDPDVHIEVWEKDPSVQAFTDLMNRALDKPAEQKQEVDLDVSLKIEWLK